MQSLRYLFLSLICLGCLSTVMASAADVTPVPAKPPTDKADVIIDLNPEPDPGMLGGGVQYSRRLIKTARGILRVNVVDIDFSNPNITIEPILANHTIHGKAKVAHVAQQHGAIAAINAAYFKPDTGTSLGALILNKELITGPLYERVSFGITADKQLKMARLALGGQLSTPAGDAFRIHNVNQPRLTGHEAILYTNRWGTLSPNTPTDGVQVQIDRDTVTAISVDRLPIPHQGAVLVAPLAAIGDRLQVGDAVKLKIYTIPDWSNVVHAISGGPYLVRNGQVYVDLKEQGFRVGGFTRSAPRTAIGLSGKNHLLMVTVEGRDAKGAFGMTLTQMAQLMQSLGSQHAMNLDGGTSTQMVVGGQIVSAAHPAGGLAVATSLIVRQTRPGAVPVGEVSEDLRHDGASP